MTSKPHQNLAQNAASAEAETNGRVLHGVAIKEPVAPQLAPAAIQMPRMLRALHYPEFRYFWAANFLSNTGTWMQNVAQGWLVLELTNSAFWLGVVGFAASVPMLGFTLLGGVIADRVDRRRMMIRTQTAMMLFAFLMAALTWLKIIDVPLIVLLAFATGVAMSLNTPSYQALVPQLVPREVLTNAIGLNSAQYNMSRVIGPTLGGFAMHWFGAAGNFFLNGLSFLALLAVLLRMRMPAPELPDESATLWQTLADGFRYVYDNRIMAALLSVVGLASILGIPYLMFIPLFARNILHVGERGFGFLMAFSGLGSFGAAITIAYFGKFRRSGKLVARAGSVFFLAVIAFTLSRSFAVSALLMALAGYSMILMVATVNSLLQHLASEEMRGRVMSIYAMAFLGFAPVGSLIAGSLAGAVTAPYAIAGMCLLGLVGIWVLYFTRPELRRLD